MKGRITARDKSLSHKYIDLTSHYNAALNENPFLESKRLPYIDEKLTGLTDGLGSYNGISFDVRGVIALHGSETQLREHVAVLTNGVEGIPIGNIEELVAHGVNFKVLAHKGVETFFTQVFVHNFFHADMHPGNILIDTTDPQNPRYIALDCAIVGTLPERDQKPSRLSICPDG